MKISLEQEQEIIIKYTEGVKISQIAKEYNCDKSTILKRLNKNNIFTGYKIDSVEIIKLFNNGKSMKDISRALNISITPIRKVLIDNNMPTKQNISYYSKLHKKYDFDENFFEKIDTEEKAYVLGFIYADGNLHKSTNSILLELSEKDMDTLIKLKNTFAPNHPLFKHEKEPNECYRLTINNYKTYQDLLNIGLTPAKSLTIKFPVIENYLIKHFIRGYFDGDGCICYNNRNRRGKFQLIGQVEFSILGSESFCLALIDYFKNIFINLRIDKSGRNKIISRVRTASRYDLIKIYKWFYEDATIFMNRKKELFEYIIKNMDK